MGIGAITGIGGVLRVTSAGRIGVFRDEAQSLEIMSRGSASSIVSFLSQHESHPPGYYLIGHFVERLGLPLPDSMSAISLLFSVGLVPLVGVLAAKSFGRMTGMIASLVTALAPGLFLYSVQARPYGLIAFLVFAATAALGWYGHSGRFVYLAGWTGLMAIAATLHYTVLIYIAAQLMVLLLALWRAELLVERGKALAGALLAMAALLLPLVLLLRRQMEVAGYEAVKPFSAVRPIENLLRAAVDYPLEFGIPVAGGLAVLALGGWRGAAMRAIDVRADPRTLCAFVLRWTGVAFIGLCFIGSYRSRLTLPHVMMTSVPFTAVLVATAISGRLRIGERLRAAVLAEALIVCVTISWILRVGFVKTNADLVARQVMAAAQPIDLLILMPGLLGTSFNRTFDGRIPQIDFPYPGPVAAYEFDRYFERMTDTMAWHATLSRARATLAAGGAVWYVLQAGWHLDSVRTSLLVPADSFSGIAQADVLRANQLQRALQRLSGPPDTIGKFERAPTGYETLNLLRYSGAPFGSSRLGRGGQ